MNAETIEVIVIIGALAMAALALVSFSIISRIKNKNNSQISFKESMDLVEMPIVTFNNANKKLNFLLDTGSNLSYINDSIIDDLEHIKINEVSDVIGIEGNKVTNQLCNMTITYKGHTFKEKFSIASLDNAFNIIKQESGVQIHGILGSKFFERYKYILDFKDLIAYIK